MSFSLLPGIYCLKMGLWTNTRQSAILVAVVGQFHRHLFVVDSVVEMPCTMRTEKVPSLRA